jgi:spore maturation protein SpmA
VDEGLCHLQDGSFQVSLSREGAMPMWMGMDGLATKSGEVPSIQTLDCPITIKLPRVT